MLSLRREQVDYGKMVDLLAEIKELRLIYSAKHPQVRFCVPVSFVGKWWDQIWCQARRNGQIASSLKFPVDGIQQTKFVHPPTLKPHKLENTHQPRNKSHLQTPFKIFCCKSRKFQIPWTSAEIPSHGGLGSLLLGIRRDIARQYFQLADSENPEDNSLDEYCGGSSYLYPHTALMKLLPLGIFFVARRKTATFRRHGVRC